MTDNENEVADLKRRLAELEAQKNAPQTVAAAPKKKGIGCFGVAAIIVVLLIIAGAIGSNSGGGSSGNTSTAALADSSASSEASSPGATEPTTSWSYQTQTDAMSDKPTRHACVTSTNEIRLESPYPNQTTQFCFRQSAKAGLDGILNLPRGGQFMCRSYEDCIVKVRVDDGPIQSYSAAGASDGSSDVIFLRNPARLVAALKGAKRLRIEAEYYEAGSQTNDFNVEAYDAAYLTGGTKAPSAGK